MKRRGFTLIEILMVVAIVGVIVVAAVAPLVYSVMRLTETEDEYNEREALLRVVSLVKREVSEIMRASKPALRIIKKEHLGGEPDCYLLVASTAPAKQNLPAGSVVYRVLRRNIFSKLPDGLYRWVLSGKLPGEIDPEKLEEKEAQLVLPGIKEFKIEVLNGSDWLDSYNGELPVGMKFTFARGEQKIEQIEWFPK